MIQENIVVPQSGYYRMVLNAGIVALGVLCLNFNSLGSLGLFLLLVAMMMLRGYYTVSPGQAALIILLGNYRGTVAMPGFYWANPLAKKVKISLKPNILESKELKVSDKNGTPIIISSTVVWQVADTAKAFFEVEAYEKFTEAQTDMILRALAASYPFDSYGAAAGKVTLRGNTNALASLLKKELETQLGSIGIHIVDAKLSHLAYAPEIAPFMLQKQQTEAILAARKEMSENAVEVVASILAKLDEKQLTQFSPNQKADLTAGLLLSLSGGNTLKS